jgi:predicted O-methyltransferase YrrM
LNLIDGWFWPDEGAWYHAAALALPRGSVLVEVGCWKGRSTAFVAPACRQRGHVLHCVDHWNGSSDDFDGGYRARLAREDVESAFRAHLADWAIDARVHKEASTSAAAHFTPASVDLVFLDASHDEASVASDLAAWWPVLRRGRLLAGHDWCNKTPGVAAAVSAFAAAKGVPVQRGSGRIWFLERDNPLHGAAATN